MGLTHDFVWWQLWSCHLWHWTPSHVLLNALALAPPLMFMPRRELLRVTAAAAIAAPLLSLTILSADFRGEYRGASALVVAAWFLAATMLIRNGERRPGLILLGVVTLKIAFEAAGWWPAPEGFAPLSEAHYAGAAIGLAAGVVWPRRTSPDGHRFETTRTVRAGSTP